jgi:hypothetical protein
MRRRLTLGHGRETKTQTPPAPPPSICQRSAIIYMALARLGPFEKYLDFRFIMKYSVAAPARNAAAAAI